MKERIIKALIVLGIIVFPFTNGKGQCDNFPDDYLSCNTPAQIVYPNIPNQNLQNGTYKIVTPGSYSFNVNNARLIVCGSGDFIFDSSCNFNSGHEIMIHKDARVHIMCHSQSTLNIINRGYLEFTPNQYNYEKIVNLNASSSFINYGTCEINGKGGLRVDGKLVNRGLINVDGELWLNSNDMICLADKSLMNVTGSSHINSSIRGDGGCLHSIGTISAEQNYVVNHPNGITPIEERVYLCTESNFSSAFNYIKGVSEKSGGAILQENCTGCSGGSSSQDDSHDDPHTQEVFESYTISLNDVTICSGTKAPLIVSVKESGNYVYCWMELYNNGEEKLIQDYSVISKLNVSPSDNTKYRVYVRDVENNREIGIVDANVYVLSAAFSISQDGGQATLVASLADSYLWNPTGAKTSYIQVPITGKNDTYSVQMTKNNVTCTSQLDLSKGNGSGNGNGNENGDNGGKGILPDDFSLNVIIEGPRSACPGTPVELTAVVSGGSGEYEYLWNTKQTSSSIKDSITSSSSYLVTVKDKKLGIEGSYIYNVNVPVWRIESQTSTSVTFNLNGNKMVISPLISDTILPVWLDNGTLCSVPVKVNIEGNTIEIVPPTADTIKVQQIKFEGDSTIVIEIDPNNDNSSVDLNVDLCKGEKLKIIVVGAENYSLDWFGLPTTSSINSEKNEVLVTPEKSDNYFLNIDNAEHTVHMVIHINVNVKHASYLIQKSSDPTKNSVTLIGQGGSKYKWTYNGNDYLTQSVEVPYPAQLTKYYLAIDDVCFDTIRLNGEDSIPMNVVIEEKIIDPDNPTADSMVVKDSYICLDSQSENTIRLTAKIAGGSGQYTYQWIFENQVISNEQSVTLSGQMPGRYDVIVTDKETGEKVKTTNYLHVMSAKINRQNETEAELIAFGGISYLWTPSGATRSSITVPVEKTAKTYVVEIKKDNHTCKVNVNVPSNKTLITKNDTMKVLLTSSASTSSICKGDSVVLSVVDVTGSGIYDYSWNVIGETRRGKSITVSPSESKYYVVKVTDRNTRAIGFDSVYVNVLSIGIDSFSTKDSIVMYAKGGSEYLWSNGATTPVIKVKKSEDLTKYSVKITDEYGTICEQYIDVNNIKSQSIDPLQIAVDGPTEICEGDTVQLLVKTNPSSQNYVYQWINNKAYDTKEIIVSPANSETYVVTVRDTITGKEATVQHRVNVMKIKLDTLRYDPKPQYVLSAQGGKEYRWSSNQGSILGTSSSIVVTPAQTTTYSVEIMSSQLTCKKELLVNPDSMCIICPSTPPFSIIGNTQVCAGRSTSLTIDFSEESKESDFLITWRNVSSADRNSRTINVFSDVDTMLKFPLRLQYIPTGTDIDYDIVVTFETCTTTETPGSDTIVNPFVPECGDPDLEDASYKMYEGVARILNDKATNDISSGNAYSSIVSEAGKTYGIKLRENSSLYVYSSVPTSLCMEVFDGTLILDGKGPFTFVSRNGDQFLSISKTGRLMINKGTEVTIQSTTAEYYPLPAKLNENSKLYNRGIVTVDGKFTMNNNSRIVNMGSFKITNGLTTNNAECNITNYNLMDIKRIDNLNNARTGMFALEAGSVTTFEKIRNVNGNTRPFCGRGCVHITNGLENVYVNHLANENVNVCMAYSNNNDANKWGASVTQNCSSCGMNVTAINKSVCDNNLNGSTVTLSLQVSGFIHSYHYEWILPEKRFGSFSYGGPLYPLEMTVPVDLSKVSKDYTISGKVVIFDENNPSAVDTVDVYYTILKCSSSSSDDTDLKVQILSSDTIICRGNRVRLSVNTSNESSAGEYSYRWSTGEMKRSIFVTPEDTTSYSVEVTYRYNGNTIVSNDTITIDVINCGEDACAENIWVNVDKFPDCSANGVISFTIMNEDEHSYPISTWYNANNDQIANNVRQISGLSAGDYTVCISYNQCQVYRNVHLTNVTSQSNTGLQLTYYGNPEESNNPNRKDSYCSFNDRIGSTLTSLSNVDLSTINAEYFIWTGFITPIYSGKYTFSSTNSIGDLYVNNKHVTSYVDSVELNANQSYMIAFIMNRESSKDNDFQVSVQWKNQGQTEMEDIPTCALTPDPLDGIFALMKKDNSVNQKYDICSDIDTVCPDLRPNIPSSYEICKEGGSVQLNAFVNGASYRWTNDKMSDKYSSSIVVATPGIYTVEITSWCGSKISKDILVRSIENSGIRATASSNVVCSGSNISLLATGGKSYEWSPKDGLSNSMVANPKLSVGKTRTYSVKIHTHGGCVVTKSVNLSIQEPFDIEVDQRIDDCLGSKVELTATGADEYIWYPNEGISCQKCSTTEVTLDQDSLVYVVEGLKNGCVVKKEVVLQSLIKKDEVYFTATRESNCQLKLSAANLGPDVEYTWSVATNSELNNLTGREVSLYFPSNGEYMITLKVRSKECDESSSIVVTKMVKVDDCDPCNDTCNK